MGLFDNLFGGSDVDASNTNSTTDNSQLTINGSIGVTGDNFVNAISVLGGTANYQMDRLFALNGESLRALQSTWAGQTAAALQFNRSSLEFTRDIADRNIMLTDRTSSRTLDALAGIINTGRDLVQRTINAATGQATPLQSLPGASNSTPVLGEKESVLEKLAIPIIVGIVLYAISQGK